MSHFSVAVFTDEYTNVDELLEPFDEKIEVEKYIAYTKEELIKIGKEDIKYFQKLYKQYMKDKRAYRRKYFDNIEHLRFIKKVPSMLKWDKERIYKFAIRFYNEEELSEDGGLYSTYNLASKWDWYVVGGRWKKMLIIRDPKKTRKFIHVNSAKVKDIRWDLMKQENRKNIKTTYEEFIKKSPLYPEEIMKEKYPNEQEYIDYMTNFITYAVLTPDGEWYEAGKMGWWGISSATPKEEREFRKDFEDNFIKNANPEWTLTIVDCHI